MKARNTKTPPEGNRARKAKPSYTVMNPGELTKAEERAHEEHVAKLVKLGIVKLGKGGIPDELFEPGPPAPSALKAVRWVRRHS